MYDISAYPPARNYSEELDGYQNPEDRILQYNRMDMLNIALDVKLSLLWYGKKIGNGRREALKGWIEDGSDFYSWHLGFYRREMLKIDRKGLKMALKGRK